MTPTPAAYLRAELADLRHQIASAVVGPPVWPRLLAAVLGALLGGFSGLYAFLVQIKWD